MLEHSKEAGKFYRSKLWSDVRLSYISSVYGLCERCQGAGRIVHHIEHINNDNINDIGILTNHDNLELLCQPCHNREHFGGETIRKGYGFDDQGNLIKFKENKYNK